MNYLVWWDRYIRTLDLQCDHCVCVFDSRRLLSRKILTLGKIFHSRTPSLLLSAEHELSGSLKPSALINPLWHAYNPDYHLNRYRTFLVIVLHIFTAQCCSVCRAPMCYDKTSVCPSVCLYHCCMTTYSLGYYTSLGPSFNCNRCSDLRITTVVTVTLLGRSSEMRQNG